MFQARDPQRSLFSARNQYRDVLKPGSFYALLADFGDQLFDDYSFEYLYCDDNGRPCRPPGQMFTLLLLQMHDGCSDEEAIERSRCDLRWLAALDLEVGEQVCKRSTLQLFRARMLLNEAAENQFKSILTVARKLGILKGPLKVAIDTTPILGRGAVKDTYNLIADGTRKVGSVLAEIEGLSPEKWAAANDFSRYWEASSIKGEAGIDWSDDSERRVFLNGLVADADRILWMARRCAEHVSEEEAAKIEEASSLLRRLVSQDTEPDPPPPGDGSKKIDDSGRRGDSPTEATPSADSTDGQQAAEASSSAQELEPQALIDEEASRSGVIDEAPVAEETETSDDLEAVSSSESHLLEQMVRIRQGVAPDRIVSAYDPEIRHGRKSSSNRFDGHKLSIIADTDSKLIVDLDVIAGNASDNQGAVESTRRAETNAGLTIETVYGDCVYGDGATRQSFKEANIDLRAKVPAPPSNKPFHKQHFKLDLTHMVATCPAGQTTAQYDYATRDGVRRPRFRFSADVCRDCPHASECLRGADRRRGSGRTVLLHPQEDLLQQARERQASPEFREDVKARQTVEHRLARLVQLGVRQARYRGRAKTKFQALMTAMVANLTVMAGAISVPSFVALQALSVAGTAESGCPCAAALAAYNEVCRLSPAA